MNPYHISISDLATALSKKPNAPLKFCVEGSPINPGYHVTEVRHAQIHSLDCGKNSSPERWNEITVQLLDGTVQSTQGHMSASKFEGIVGNAIESLAVDTAPFLVFEFAPGNGPIRKLRIHSIDLNGDGVTVVLGSEKAVCKPFQRLKLSGSSPTLNSGIAAIDASTEACCSDGSHFDVSACCGSC